MIPLKICGLREPANLAEIAALQPDYVGFIFYPPSPRWVGTQLRAETLAHLPAGVQKVGVFVNETPAAMLATAQKFNLNAVQLHGQEPPAVCAELLAAGLQVWKVCSVANAIDPAFLVPYQSVCTHFLFDTATAAHGGSGKTFDWDLLDALSPTLPTFMSGGIGPANLDAALAKASQLGFGLDINSGLETTPGHKDPALAAALVQRVRTYSPPICI